MQPTQKHCFGIVPKEEAALTTQGHSKTFFKTLIFTFLKHFLIYLMASFYVLLSSSNKHSGSQ